MRVRVRGEGFDLPRAPSLAESERERVCVQPCAYGRASFAKKCILLESAFNQDTITNQSNDNYHYIYHHHHHHHHHYSCCCCCYYYYYYYYYY